MRTFRFDKLVRDKIPPEMKREGSRLVSRRLSDEEYVEELIKKIKEEIEELTSSADKLSEIADLRDILDALTEVLGVTEADVKHERIKKDKRFGAFKDRLYVEQVSVDESNPWMQRYLADPDKYPEVK